jgi:hypothetical protein
MTRNRNRLQSQNVIRGEGKRWICPCPHNEGVEGVTEKIQVLPVTCQEDTEVEYRYTSTLSVTSALDGVGVERHAPPLYSQNNPVPIVYEAGWAPGPVWTCAENVAPPGFDPGPSSL